MSKGPLYSIERRYKTSKDEWSKWEKEFSFNNNLAATNDLFHILANHFKKAMSPIEIAVVDHEWRIYEENKKEVIEISSDYKEDWSIDYGCYDVAGVGEIPEWAKESEFNRNVGQYLREMKKNYDKE